MVVNPGQPARPSPTQRPKSQGRSEHSKPDKRCLFHILLLDFSIRLTADTALFTVVDILAGPIRVAFSWRGSRDLWPFERPGRSRGWVDKRRLKRRPVRRTPRYAPYMRAWGAQARLTGEKTITPPDPALLAIAKMFEDKAYTSTWRLVTGCEYVGERLDNYYLTRALNYTKLNCLFIS